MNQNSPMKIILLRKISDFDFVELKPNRHPHSSPCLAAERFPPENNCLVSTTSKKKVFQLFVLKVLKKIYRTTSY